MTLDRVEGAAELHAAARLDSRDAVGWDGVFVGMPIDEVVAVRVAAGEIEEIDAGEDDEEAAEEGEGIDGVGGVEAAEENEGGAERGGREGDVVERVDSVKASVRIPGRMKRP